jgi:antitoxin component YwqK of YwqJK toxin-antitoxin module
MPYRIIIAITLSLALAGCAKNYETVETRTDDGQVERFQRRKKDSARHGLYQKINASGTVIEEAHYVNDTLDGEHTFFFPTGKVESVERFRKGVFHGKYQKYHDNGQLELEQEFVDGQLTGLSVRYYPNGQLREKVTLRDNEENGPFTEYHENGQLRTEGTYADGPNEQGELKEYDEAGQLIRIADCVNGKCTTRWKK